MVNGFCRATNEPPFWASATNAKYCPPSVALVRQAKILAPHPRDREDRNLRILVRSPHHPRPNKLRLPQRVVPVGYARLHQHGLRRVIDLRRNKADPRIRQHFALAVEYLHWQIHLQLRGMLDRYIDVRLKASRLIDR